MLRSSCRWLPAAIVFAAIGTTAEAQIEATFAKLTPVQPTRRVLPDADKARVAVFSPDADRVASIDADGVLRIVIVNRPGTKWRFPAQDQDGSADATSIAWSRDGNYIVTGHADGNVRKFMADTGEKVWQRQRHDGRVNDVAVSRDADRVASAGDDKTVRVFDAAGQQIWISRLHNARVASVDISNNGKFVLSGARDGDVLLAGAAYEPETTTPVLVRRFRKSDVPIIKVRLDPKVGITDPLEVTAPGSVVGDPGTDPIKIRLLIADTTNKVTYYDLEKTKPMRVRRFDADVVDVDLSSVDQNGDLTAIVGTKSGVFAYRPQSADSVGWRLESIPVPYCVAISDDGRHCLAGVDAMDPNSDKNPGSVAVYVVN